MAWIYIVFGWLLKECDFQGQMHEMRSAVGYKCFDMDTDVHILASCAAASGEDCRTACVDGSGFPIGFQDL